MSALTSYLFIAPSITAYTQLIGNGSNTSFTIEHNLNKTSLYLQITEVATGAIVYPDMTINSSNTATVAFSITPSTNSYRVDIVG